MGLISDFFELLYPTCCPGCGEGTSPDTVWCEPCFRHIWDPRLIQTSRTAHLHGCYTLCNYEGPLRECIIQLKYGGRTGRKQVFPPLLNRFPYWDRLEECEAIFPVPLSKKKKKERGYNQVDMMFGDWMTKRGLPYMADGLVRFRNTGTQSLLSRKERYNNIKGAFHINRGIQVQGKIVLVVDDVFTTGATMEAVAHELRRAGAKKVLGLTIASGAL